MLQFITHPKEGISILNEIRQVVDGGCRWVQLRMKDASREEIIETAKENDTYFAEANQSDYP